jgi:glutathione S-transferase
MVQGEKVVSDSWKIALYFEDAYPEAPSLFGGPEALALSALINDWVDLSLMESIGHVVMSDVHARIAEQDKAYFRVTREKWWEPRLRNYPNVEQPI